MSAFQKDLKVVRNRDTTPHCHSQQPDQFLSSFRTPTWTKPGFMALIQKGISELANLKQDLRFNFKDI